MKECFEEPFLSTVFRLKSKGIYKTNVESGSGVIVDIGSNDAAPNLSNVF